MTVKQVSVFLENKSGRLLDVTRRLGEAGVNVRAMCVADTSEFGVVRLIADDPDKARDILREHGFIVKETTVIAVEVEDRPGGLSEIIKPLVDQEMNIEYLYCFLEKSGKNAVMIIRVEEAEQAVGALKVAGFRVIPEDELYSM
ncbi:MAG: amino acid-binding protein [Actinobacteria bacterium]|nr:amino acid-binding protein [Actinomycetota bacterium]MCG2796788.1 amino acid-binding protein [Actinomycetes bacterium]MBU4240270.1 amino acid-binding protein [Actinomycetota bacterium]MBU4301315.1 amino acid-binding protein [Actinomycetota bacterium]MBU4386248.1 amino acid-binding protein [Actinomycetota bacterium]